MEMHAKALRAALRELTPAKTIPAVQSFELDTDEELFILEADVRHKSITQIAQERHVSEETVKRKREKGFYRMILELNS